MQLFSLRRRNTQSQTYSDHHRNWLLTIAHIKMPIVLFGAGAIALIVTLLTFLFDPVYEAKTLITLDANLSKTLKSIDIPYPYTTAQDYIRYEFFATHSVTLMHSPQLADQFVKRWNIKDGSGKIMFSEYLINPNLFRLLFSNNGQGIKAQWVSDTQQFSIAGYSKDPDTAVAYSRDYTESFLKEDANSARSALGIIVERLDNQILEISGQREAVDVQIQQVKKRYRIADLADENTSILTLKAKIQELTRSLVGQSVELTKEHPAYKVTEETLKTTLKVSESRLEDLITAQSKLNKLTDQRTQLSGLLSTALTNHSNVSNIMKKPVPFFRVVSPASINKDKLTYYKYFPKRKFILPLTFMASLFALSFLVIAKELYTNILYCGWQLSALKHYVDYVDVPILGISATNPKSDFDAIICKHIHEMCLSTNDAQIVRITSGANGEGKATIARAMALYHHKMGKSVALVDGDLKHHSSSSWFGLNERPGLMDYICGQKEPADIIIRDQIPNMSFIPAGSQGNLGLKPFALKPLTELFSILTSDYEKIIFVDAPFSDSHFMLADMLPPHDIIIVVQSGEHSIYEVDRWTGMSEFTEGKATLKGIIINKIII
jgi:tyrosine-protein kinase Etk/Wzc